MSRRSSNRISGGPVDLDPTSGRVRTLDSPGRARKSEVVFGKEGVKRRKKEIKTTMFKPQPIPSTSSDTPPENEDDAWTNIPPPPSERKIARRRSSIKKAVPMEVETPAPAARTRGSDEDLLQSLRSDDNLANGAEAGPSNHIQALSFASTSRSPLPGHRPLSPPRQKLGFTPLLEPGPSRSTNGSGSGSMGPPTAYARKTRKSLKSLGHGLPDQEKRESLLMPIPDSETPMIRKNQEMREAQRRSSLSMRGQRASTSLGKGEITIPHSSVDPSMFYRHISPLIPEPIRARHLIAWCGKRAGDAEVAARTRKKRSADQDPIHRTEDGDRLIAAILGDFGAALGKGLVDTNIMAQAGAPPISSLAPHPRNVANREIKDKEEAVIQRCKAEIHLWDRLHKSAHSKAQNEHSELREKRRADLEPDVYAAEDGWMRDAIKLADRLIRDGEGSMKDSGDFADVEYKVDTLLQNTHSAVQYSHQAQRFLDGIFESLTRDLRAHDTRRHLPSGSQQTDTLSLLFSSARPSSSEPSGSTTRADDVMDMLRAIASLESSNPDPEVLAKARALEALPLPSILSSSVGPGTKGWTPRRVTSATTPRR